jgi:hypothetical protein
VFCSESGVQTLVRPRGEAAAAAVRREYRRLQRRLPRDYSRSGAGRRKGRGDRSIKKQTLRTAQPQSWLRPSGTATTSTAAHAQYLTGTAVPRDGPAAVGAQAESPLKSWRSAALDISHFRLAMQMTSGPNRAVTGLGTKAAAGTLVARATSRPSAAQTSCEISGLYRWGLHAVTISTPP